MPTPDNDELTLTSSEIYLAAQQGVLLQDDAERLVRWGFEQRVNRSGSTAPAVEQPKGFNLVTVAYYFGAMLMIAACAWFLGDKWDKLGSVGVLVTIVVYMLTATGVGWWLRKRGFIIGGSLLITVAVCLVPVLTYAVEKMLGLWHDEYPGPYGSFYPWVNGSRMVMEVATIAAAAIALRYVRFAFLTAPMAFSLWLLSIDLAAVITRNAQPGLETRKWITVTVGLCILLVSYGLDKFQHKTGEPRSEDFAFWCYLFGMLAFWGGLTSMNSDSEVKQGLYALLNVAFMWLAVKLRRATFLIFGALGVFLYLGHLAYEVFNNSLFFPFVLAFLGLLLIVLTVWMQRRVLARARA